MLTKMSDADYFKDKSLSNSFLVRLSKSMAHAKTPITPTPAMETGTMIHRYFLEQADFFNLYIHAPKIDKRTKDYKEFAKENEGKLFITEADSKMLDGITESLKNYYLKDENPFETKNNLPAESAYDIIKKSETEIAGFWEQDGQKCKMKIDAIYNKTLLIDLKKTYDVEQFKWSVKKYKYYRQAAFYLSGYKAITGIDAIFVFLAIESAPPYGVKAFKLSDASLKQGYDENHMAIWTHKHYKPSKKIYADGVEEL